MKRTKTYILITAAKNEEAYIGKTIESVINQTVKPICWVIVNDGSTDNTATIVEKYSKKNPFIHLINLSQNRERHFAGKVNAIEKGFEFILKSKIEYDYFGNLDADVSFGVDYYETMITRMNKNQTIGIAGGKVHDLENGTFKPQLNISDKSVAGPIQFFRRKTYEEIGGYLPSKMGLVDAIAEVTARMKGWNTVTYNDISVYHYRLTGSAKQSVYQIALKNGKKEFLFGYHPLFHLARSIQLILASPVFIGSILRTYSFFHCYFDGTSRIVSNEFVQYLRKEELRKLLFFINPLLIIKYRKLAVYLNSYE